MPAQLDLYGEKDPRANRYAWALARALPMIGLFALIAGLASMFVVGGSEYRDESTIAVSDASPTFASVGLADSFEKVPPAFDAMQFLLGYDYEGPDVDVAVVRDLTNDQAIRLTISGSSRAEVESASTAYLSALNSWIGQRRAEATAPLSVVLDQQRSSLQQRRDELDTEIAGLPDTGALRDAFLDERADLTTALLRTDTQQQAVAAFNGDANRIDAMSSTATQSNTRMIWFVIGAVLGALVGCVLVLIRTHLDRRVRTQAELADLAAGARVLPVLPAAGDEREPAIGAVLAAIERLGQGNASLVPVGHASVATAQALAGRLNDATPRDLLNAADLSSLSSPTVVIAVAGRTRAEDVSRTMQYLDALGHPADAVLLAGVSPRQLRRSVA